MRVPTGTLLSEAARLAGVEILQPCGGQGRCGRCAVQVEQGTVRRRSTLRLSENDVAAGYALACQSVIEADVQVTIPAQEKIERRLTTDRVAAEVSVPVGYDRLSWQPIQRVALTLTPPSMDDQTDDWGRLRTALRKQADIPDMRISLNLLQRIGSVLRQGEWQVTAIYETDTWDCTDCVPRLIDLLPGHQSNEDPLWAAAIDIGTTTVSLWLVDLVKRAGACPGSRIQRADRSRRGCDLAHHLYRQERWGRRAAPACAGVDQCPGRAGV